MAINERGHRIIAEAKANLSRLKGSEQRFAAEREESEQARGEFTNNSPQREQHVETRAERHRRELAEQQEEFARDRRERERQQQRSKQADWSDWERWADAKIEAALAAERHQVCTAIGKEMRAAVRMIYEDIADEVKGLRTEITNLKVALERQQAARSENTKVVDLMSQTRRAN